MVEYMKGIHHSNVAATCVITREPSVVHKVLWHGELDTWNGADLFQILTKIWRPRDIVVDVRLQILGPIVKQFAELFACVVHMMTRVTVNIFEVAFRRSFTVYLLQPAALSHRVIFIIDRQQCIPSLP